MLTAFLFPELTQVVHCSIIGTCLSSAEIRRLLAQLGVPGADAADDHDLHVRGTILERARL